ncbi:RNA-binding domain-containing protein [Nemania sp. FL0916]|nr:RNA-binding domain-containing protein [Nemania sp. FL0916]
MYSVRRAALRAACASPRFVAVPRQQVAAIAMQLSKANVQPAGVLPMSRYFSKTAFVAEDKDSIDPAAEHDSAAVESAIEAADQPSTTKLDDLVESNGPTSQPMRPKSHTIFISNMTFDATDVHLTEAFGKYGEILSVNIARDGRGLSRGFGFISFSSPDAVERAVQEANNSFWHGRRILVQPRKERPSQPRRPSNVSGPTNSLYVGNIPYEASDADLNQMFRSLDGVTDVRVAVDRNTGWPRGFAHADFVDVPSAERALQVLLEKTLNGRQLRVDYAETRMPPNRSSGSGGSGGSGGFGGSGSDSF